MKASEKYECKDGDGYEMPMPGSEGPVHFDYLEDLVLTGMFGFCGCGAPDAAGKYILAVLKLIRAYNDEQITWEQRDAQFPNEDIRYFTLYVLDKEGLTEHGGSVNGSWLTDKGKEVIELLTEVYGTEYSSALVSENQAKILSSDTQQPKNILGGNGLQSPEFEVKI